MEQQESFDDMTPIELPKETPEASGSSNTDGLDTFDNDEALGLDDSQVSQLEDKEQDEPKKEEPSDKVEDKKDDKEEQEKKEESEPKEDEGDAKPLPRGKSLKLKDESGNTSEVSLDATVKLKVNGKNEIVTMQELRDNYSGKVAYEEKFSAIQAEKAEVESNLKQFTEERNELAGHLRHIGTILDDPDGNPMDALNYLVDMSGRSTLDYNKKVMSFMSNEVRNLDGMDEVERDLYWKNKELDAIRGNQSAKEERESQAKAQRESEERINRLRESNGVTEELYVQSREELKSLGYDEKDITPERAVEYAVIKPHYETAEKVCADHEEDLSTDEMNKLVTTVANTLRSNPKLPEEKALEISVGLLGWDIEREEDFKELNQKAGMQSTEPKKSKTSYKYGSSQEDDLDLFED